MDEAMRYADSQRALYPLCGLCCEQESRFVLMMNDGENIDACAACVEKARVWPEGGNVVDDLMKRLEVGANSGRSLLETWPDVQSLAAEVRRLQEALRVAENAEADLESAVEVYRLRLIDIRKIAEGNV